MLYYRDAETGGYRCLHCSFSSDRSYNVKSHVEARHVTTGGLPCQLCGTVCPTRKALRMHVFRRHRPV
jgi:Pyruvate/2-oxoacid:ferredoxin oxidoreductase delta subunit